MASPRRRFYVPLPDGATTKLQELARREMRDPKSQAAYLILSGLRAAGLDPDKPEQQGAERAPR